MLIVHNKIPLKRWIFPKNTRLSTLLARNYASLPPRKSYYANSNPIQLFWNTKVSPTVKYCSLIALLSVSISHIHHDILITAGPPSLLGGWYLYTKWRKLQYSSETQKIVPTSKTEFDLKDNNILIKKYDETEISNVLNGVDNEFDNFKRQVVDIIERRIVDYVISNQDQHNEIFSLFIDANNQFSVKLNENDIETFIILSVSVPEFEKMEDNDINLPSEHSTKPFVKFSLPFYSSKDASTRKRLGIIECYLLGINDTPETNQIAYKISIEISPYKLFATTKEKLIIRHIEGQGVYKSQMILDEENNSDKSQTQDEEEITVNI